MKCTVLECNFETIFPVWRNCLWPERIEPIEATSALLFKEGFDLEYKSSEVFFVKMEWNQKIIGVCSGQRTGPQEFRSRGLWVSEDMRRKGIGSTLFYSVEKEVKKRGCSHLWTLARYSSKQFYLSMKMKNCGKTYQFEYGPHFWMSKTV